MSDKEHELQARRLANAIAYGGGDQPVGYVDAAKKLAFSEVIGENERLKEAIRRLADQDATLSVVGGNVIVEMDAITDKEYAAIEIAVAWVDKFDEPDVVAALEGLLKRAGGLAKADSARRLAPEEKEAIRAANAVLLGCSGDPERLAKHANVLRGLLERTK